MLPYCQPSWLTRFELGSEWNQFVFGCVFGEVYPFVIPKAIFSVAFSVGPLGPWNVYIAILA